jgi:hypothetical protein
MKKWLTGLLTACTLLLALPASADAAFRLGADVIWMPAATTNVDADLENVELDSTHNVASYGASAHFNLGFDIFALGAKINYFSQGIKLPSQSIREDEIDVNAMSRIQFPTTDFAVVAEAGLSTTPDQSGWGFNAGAAAEYDVLGMPLFDLHLGMMGQYVNFPTEYNDSPTDIETLRGMIYLGADFSL